MSRVLIFGGTTEGREAVKSRLRDGDDVTVCVTSEYARGMVPPGIRCHVRPMNLTEMTAFLLSEAPDLVIDATHPFAIHARENIRVASARAGIKRIRHARASGSALGWADAVQWVPDANAAAEALRETEGNILLTTGSHTLEIYLETLHRSRIYARVLPDSGVLKKCEALLLPPGHLISMQGPFTQAMNAALYDAWDIRILVSKDSGEPGGVSDKVLPALKQGIHIIMIRRPKEE